MKTLEVASPSPPGPALRVKKVLVPTDFSAASQKAFNYALGFARQFGSEIVLVHVLEPLTAEAVTDTAQAHGARWIHTEEKLLTLAETAPRTGNLYVTSTVRHGAPAHEIVEAAKEFDVDLIITATHGLNRSSGRGIGDTADCVARAAPCPVLIVRERERDFV